MKIALKDISRQNARMIGGEDTYDDIRRHAREWIAEHRQTVDRWLAAAKALQEPGKKIVAGDVQPAREKNVLKVVTLRSEPFVIYHDGQYGGFSIELWDEIAKELDIAYTIYGVNTIAKLLDDVQRGFADLAVAGIGITSQREKILDFSHAYYEAGLQIMVLEGADSVLREVLSIIHAVLFSSEAIYALGIFIVVLLIAAHLIWFLERRDNPQFPTRYPQGIWQSVWWAVVTVTTVGYGDKTPKRAAGRLFGIIWIMAGYFVFAYFTASVTTTATLKELYGTINGPEDLFGKKVATVEKSTAATYLYEQGMALKVRSPHRDRINVALLKLMEDGTYQQITGKWFGRRD